MEIGEINDHSKNKNHEIHEIHDIFPDFYQTIPSSTDISRGQPRPAPTYSQADEEGLKLFAQAPVRVRRPSSLLKSLPTMWGPPVMFWLVV